ncbi:MAG: hypothetical protein ACLPUT_13495 [Solirubrobacteraceae bacterium]
MARRGRRAHARGPQPPAHRPAPARPDDRRCALARTESRGAHLRADHPERDPAFDFRHALVTGEDAISWETWH